MLNFKVEYVNKNNKVLVTVYPAVKYYRGIGSSEVVPNREYKSLIDSLNEVGIKADYSLTVEMSEFNSIVYGNVYAACLKAQECDTTIVTVGNGYGVEIESRDRQNIKLSKEEYDLVKYLRKYSKKLIVIVYAGSAVDLNLIHELSDAVILAGFGGQCVSDALANILCGNISPSGRLSETYPKSLDDIPSTHSYMDEKVMVYEEKENIGYRYFATNKVDVLYPFGYGLSYADFEYSNFNIEVIDNKIIVCVDVFNNSSISAKEVVQLYCYRDDVTNRPLKELKAFTKIVLQPGETKRVQLTLGKKDFYDYDVDNKIWKLLEHNFRLAISKDCNNDLFIKKINV